MAAQPHAGCRQTCRRQCAVALDPMPPVPLFLTVGPPGSAVRAMVGVRAPAPGKPGGRIPTIAHGMRATVAGTGKRTLNVRVAVCSRLPEKASPCRTRRRRHSNSRGRDTRANLKCATRDLAFRGLLLARRRRAFPFGTPRPRARQVKPADAGPAQCRLGAQRLRDGERRQHAPLTATALAPNAAARRARAGRPGHG
jgi:hypothetical protein